MTLSQRQKLTIIPLLLYWPAIFIFAHIPIPELVYRAQVSDKSIHLLGYLVLIFLLWFSLSPDKKVSWRRAAVWLVLLVVICYSAGDEILQKYVGRKCDFKDFLADLAGALAGLILFTFLTFWPALLVVTGTAVLILTNLARANLDELLPITSAVFYLSAYGVFTLVWIRYLYLFLSLKAPQLKWLTAVLILPTALVISVELVSILLGRGCRPTRIIFCSAGSAAVVIIFFLVALYRRKSAQK